MEEDVDVDLVPLEVLLDLWRVRWDRQYVRVPAGTFWYTVGKRLWRAGWMVAIDGSPSAALFKLRERPVHDQRT